MSIERNEILGDLRIASGHGAPTHTAPAGSWYADVDTGAIYIRRQVDAATAAWITSAVAGFPTSDPGASGAMWNDAGALKSSVAVRKATTTLTDAQIKVLPTTGWIELVAAPGVGKLAVPVQVVYVIKNTAAPYTNVSDAANNGLALYYGGLTEAPAHQICPAVANWLLADGSADGLVMQTVMGVSDANPSTYQNYLADGENQPIVVSVKNASLGALTGGDPANTLTVMVIYVVVDL